MIVSLSYVNLANMLILSSAVVVNRYMQFAPQVLFGFNRNLFITSKNQLGFPAGDCLVTTGLCGVNRGLLLLRCGFYSTPSKHV